MATVKRAGESAVVAATEARAAPGALPWRALLREAALLWLVWQIVLIAFTYTALTFAVANSLRSTPAYVVTPDRFYQAWVRFDGNWYVQIAAHGYSVSDTIAFFPLYPLLIRIVAFVCFGNVPLAAVVTARLADFGVCLGILALARHETRGDRTVGRLALAITLAFPMAFFLAAAYTESLFLALACFSLLFARRHSWGLAALFAFAAILTHPRGVILFLPLAWEWARTERPWEHWREWRVVRTGAMVLGAVPLGYLLVLALVAFVVGGSPFAKLDALHAGFGRVSLPPWEIVRLIFGTIFRATPGTLDQAYNFFDIGLVLAASVVVIVAIVRRSMPAAFALYSIVLILGTIATPTPNHADAFLSAGRAIIPLVPVYLVLARWSATRPWLTWLLLGGGLCLEATLAAFFLNGGWLI